MLASSRTLVAAALLLAPTALAQSTTKLSASAGGVAGYGVSTLDLSPDTMSPDGRFVVFTSSASNLVAGDTNFASDIFLRDTVAGTIERVSLVTGGGQGGDASNSGAVSDDGRFIAFQSVATNLAVGDFNSASDVFIHDRQTGVTTIVSVANSGALGNGASLNPSISGDGTLVAFESAASNLAVSDPNGASDVFVRNLTTNTTRLVSRIPGGALGNAASKAPALSGDGRFLAFETLATNLAPGATASYSKILLRDLATGTFELVSVNSGGTAADAASIQPSITSDGSRVAFLSTAGNLVSTVPGAHHAYLRDRTTGSTTRIDSLPDGTLANGVAQGVRLSNNGLFASLLSTSSSLTPGHNGMIADAFVFDVSTRVTLRASVPQSLPGEPNQGAISAIGSVSDDGRFTAFQSNSTNLLPGEPLDVFLDVYLRDSLTNWYRDLDGDLYGDTANFLSAAFQPGAGYVLTPGDCDDTNPAVHPDVFETCNGVDDDCDGSVDDPGSLQYCTTAASTLGCIPTITASGLPSSSASAGLFVQASLLPGGKQAIAIYGLAPASLAYSFGSLSFICVAAPRQRTLNLPTGGTAGLCDGSYSLDWLAWMSAHPAALGQPLQPGQTIYSQVWYRDPGAVLNSNLTGGLAFTLCL